MKTTCLISIILLTPLLSWSQRPMLPIAPPQRPSRPNNGNVVVGGDLILPGAPLYDYTNEMAPPDPAEMDTNQFVEAEPVNNEATTNDSPEIASALEMTNRLAVMAPTQVQAVIQVQAGLESLQQVAVSIADAPSIQQAIQENAQVRQQIQAVSSRIISLARGPVRPSSDSVDRLSVDLLRTCSRAHLNSGQQLLLSIVINVIVNCQGIPAGEVESAVNNGLIILSGAGVSPAMCNAFGCDLNSIALELEPNSGI